ncbi:hypothetical protein ST201phi2-1p089 [Pseudomonas phage 201phi2-1]|uniref:Uncharacterized protein n=1 Tax=Pseudomonas phage 201phi2-1 TaxID=198110 RepID=B3FIV3_BP201|nr:hypothetical protein ST201phi2-1p089 [Pseudomonas phage 201phi2-1]ABY62922.1 hypothetical protein 201phi2-1p089 [Pseudomonas phage 201phi2-1]
MEQRSIRSLIANLKRHYNLMGEEILACYDTAVNGLWSLTEVKYPTVSVSPSNWKKLADKLDLDAQVKHPGSNVPCLLLFNGLYVRSEARVADCHVLWVSTLGCYCPTSQYLVDSMQRVVMSSKSTKKQIEYANRVLNAINKRLEKV